LALGRREPLVDQLLVRLGLLAWAQLGRLRVVQLALEVLGAMEGPGKALELVA
jgi:hypothetical protein